MPEGVPSKAIFQPLTVLFEVLPQYVPFTALAPLAQSECVSEGDQFAVCSSVLEMPPSVPAGWSSN